MTVIEALRLAATYPLPSNYVEKICITRGLTIDSEFDKAISNSSAYRLAEADVKLLVANGGVNVSEGGTSISLPERDALREEALAVYSALGEPLPVKAQPAVRILEDW